MRIKTISTVFITSLMAFIALPVVAGDTNAMSMTSIPVTVKNDYKVQLNNTKIIYLPQAAAAVVVGNPDIADVSVHSPDTLFIVGRGYGETNLIILNQAGHTVMNANIHVGSQDSKSHVRVYSGSGLMRTTFNCSPYCQPSPVLGDDANFINANTNKVDPITNTVAGDGTAGSVPSTGAEGN